MLLVTWLKNGGCFGGRKRKGMLHKDVIELWVEHKYPRIEQFFFLPFVVAMPYLPFVEHSTFHPSIREKGIGTFLKHRDVLEFMSSIFSLSPFMLPVL